MKASAVAWLGEVPGHWQQKRLRFVLRMNPSSREVKHLELDDDISFVPMEAVGERGGLNLDVTRPATELAGAYTYFGDGDVVIAKITPCFENGKGALAAGLTNGVAVGTTELYVLRPLGSELDSRFLFYLSISQPFRAMGEASMYGAGGQKRVPDTFVKDFRAPLPPPDEQRTIAAFLDRETARIDALVAAKRRLIALLQEKRAALIARAVTRGLDPEVPTKDSGVAWLGRVPTHWEVAALGYLSSIATGATPARDEPSYWGGAIPWLKTGEVNWKPIYHAEEFITDEAVTSTAVKLSKPGTLMMAMYGQGATRGRVALLEIEAAYNQACAAVSFGPRVIPAYGRYFFMAAYNYIRDAGNETSQMNLSAGVIGKLRMTVPLHAEQERIVAFVDSETAKLDASLGIAEATVERLAEYRSTLITSAVTGRIDVRAA